MKFPGDSGTKKGHELHETCAWYDLTTESHCLLRYGWCVRVIRFISSKCLSVAWGYIKELYWTASSLYLSTSVFTCLTDLLYIFLCTCVCAPARAFLSPLLLPGEVCLQYSRNSPPPLPLPMSHHKNNSVITNSLNILAQVDNISLNSIPFLQTLSIYSVDASCGNHLPFMKVYWNFHCTYRLSWHEMLAYFWLLNDYNWYIIAAVTVDIKYRIH